MDPVEVLPSELTLTIFSLLEPDGIHAALQVSQHWSCLLSSCPLLWKHLCDRHCCHEHVNADHQLGYSWKEVFMRNYGNGGIKRRWLDGQFSSPDYLQTLPVKHMCPMDAHTWGQILEKELSR